MIKYWLLERLNQQPLYKIVLPPFTNQRRVDEYRRWISTLLWIFSSALPASSSPPSQSLPWLVSSLSMLSMPKHLKMVRVAFFCILYYKLFILWWNIQAISCWMWFFSVSSFFSIQLWNDCNWKKDYRFYATTISLNQCCFVRKLVSLTSKEASMWGWRTFAWSSSSSSGPQAHPCYGSWMLTQGCW